MLKVLLAYAALSLLFIYCSIIPPAVAVVVIALATLGIVLGSIDILKYFGHI